MKSRPLSLGAIDNQGHVSLQVVRDAEQRANFARRFLWLTGDARRKPCLVSGI
jgi:hypothetical protein